MSKALYILAIGAILSACSTQRTNTAQSKNESYAACNVL